MTTYYFFRQDELKSAKKEKRNAVPVFSITSDEQSIRHYIRKYELFNEFIWQEI